jgi:hypothetical protein
VPSASRDAFMRAPCDARVRAPAGDAATIAATTARALDRARALGASRTRRERAMGRRGWMGEKATDASDDARRVPDVRDRRARGRERR